MNIILAHGYSGFCKRLGIEYFNGVEKYLTDKENCNVLVTEVSAFGTIQDRGNQLKKQITEWLDKQTEKRPTHIIAHSMGGLDSRYILCKKTLDNIGERITSLTTIGTPHRGSRIADIVYGDQLLPDAGLEVEDPNILRRILEFFGINTNAGLKDLTTKSCKIFDETTTDHPNVTYFWTTGRGRSSFSSDGRTSALLLAGYVLLMKDGDNDGLVSVESAKHGRQMFEFHWDADHMDEVGHDLDRLGGKSEKFRHLDQYGRIINQLIGL